jgi:hypothetical protein
MLNKQLKYLAQHANETGAMHPATFAMFIEQDENSFWEWWATNNPSGILGLYIKAGNTGLVQHPHVNNVHPIIRKLLDQGNYKELVYLLNNVPYNPNVKNISTNPAVWKALGYNPGNFFGVFSHYYPKQIARAQMPVHVNAAQSPVEIRGGNKSGPGLGGQNNAEIEIQ